MDKSTQFGEDPMDHFSIPTKEVKTKLTRMYVMDKREKPEKPGRALSVVWDERRPLFDGFVNRYSYIVRFSDKSSMAGHHYHVKRNEFYSAMQGGFKVILENVKNKEREELSLQAADNTFLYVPPHHAHLVIPQSDECVLLVVTDYPELASDQFDYKVEL
jgi:hypothetical protein